MNALLDHFTDDDETYPWYASVLEAFEGLPDTNPLRRLYTELYAYRFTGREPAGELDSIPLLSREFTYGVMSLMAKIRNGTGEHEPDYASFDTWCSYHAHVDEAEKIACAYFVPDTGSDNGGIVEVISDEE